VLPGRGRSNDGQGSGDKAGNPTLNETKEKKLINVLGKGHQQRGASKTESSPDEHHPPAIAVPQPSPEGPGKDGDEKGGGVDEPTPSLHVLQFFDSQLTDVERKEREDQGHSQNGQEFRGPEAVEVTFPGFQRFPFTAERAEEGERLEFGFYFYILKNAFVLILVFFTFSTVHTSSMLPNEDEKIG
jgi:hypothetical protein